MHNILRMGTYLCPRINHQRYSRYPMKKSTTALSFSSLLLLGGVSYLAAKLADLDLTFFFDNDDDHAHYC